MLSKYMSHTAIWLGTKDTASVIIPALSFWGIFNIWSFFPFHHIKICPHQYKIAHFSTFKMIYWNKYKEIESNFEIYKFGTAFIL